MSTWAQEGVVHAVEAKSGFSDVDQGDRPYTMWRYRFVCGGWSSYNRDRRPVEAKVTCPDCVALAGEQVAS